MVENNKFVFIALGILAVIFIIGYIFSIFSAKKMARQYERGEPITINIDGESVEVKEKLDENTFKIYKPSQYSEYYIEDKNLNHEKYGNYVETIESRKLWLLIKSVFIFAVVFLFFKYMPIPKADNIYMRLMPYIIGVILIGYGIYILSFIPSKITFYENGFVYKTIFKEESYNYNNLAITITREYNLPRSVPVSERRPIRLWTTVVILTFYSEEHTITLKSSAYAHLRVKAEHLKDNLIILK